MLRDARLGAGGEVLQADVCVVGAGPAGVSLALGLVEEGLKVIVLEAGPAEPDLENQRFAGGDVRINGRSHRIERRHRFFG